MKKKASKKQIQEVLSGLIGDIQVTYQKVVNTESLLGLYLEFKKDRKGFDKFIKDRIKKHEADSKK